jgi:hypothetical protein
MFLAVRGRAEVYSIVLLKSFPHPLLAITFTTGIVHFDAKYATSQQLKP